MENSAENNSNQVSMKPTNGQGKGEMGTRRFGVELGNNRRALSVINQNLGGAAQRYPCVVNKRALSQINYENNVLNQAHRPITRQLAAQIANKKQCFPEEIKKPKPSIESFSVWVDTTTTDVEDQPVPMFLETSENMADQKDQPEEVEMEDIFEEPVENIDLPDANNPLAAVEYVEDLHAYYKKMEIYSLVPTDYMSQQLDINERMRAILIDWLIEVHHKFELVPETLFLTVNLIDRFLAKQRVVRKKLQLVGLVALLLASKYEEVTFPVVEDLIFIADKAYTRSDLLEMEKLMLNTLQFNMSLPTPYVFMKRFLKAAQGSPKLEQISFFLAELCLVEYSMLKFPPSILAAASIYTAHCSLYGLQQWTRTCEWHSNYSEDQLLECSRMIVRFHQNAGTGRMTGVYRKYNTSKFGYAAKSEPAKFLSEETQ